jgi:hypothetical protein
MNGKTMKRMILVACILLIRVLSYAEVGGIYRGRMYHSILNDEKILDSKNLMVLGLTLYDSSLKDAQDKIGKTPILEKGTPPRDEAQICYQGSNSVLLLFSPDTSTTGETQQSIQSAIISRDKHIKELFAPCTESPKMNNLTFFGGLHLGMSRADVKKIWGEPGKVAPGVMIYEIRRIQKEYFTDDVSLYMEFENDKLTFMDVSRLAIH